MSRRPDSIDDIQAHFGDAADMAALRANLALSPLQRMAELVAMNRFHADVQARTLAPWLRDALEAREIDEAFRRLREVAA